MVHDISINLIKQTRYLLFSNISLKLRIPVINQKSIINQLYENYFSVKQMKINKSIKKHVLFGFY
jgi:hypothetical protein